jgi:hypothetical protein
MTQPTPEPMSVERKARISNGLIVVVACALTIWDHRFVWLILFMGASLIFSGLSDFCGFAVIFKRFQTDPPEDDTPQAPRL